MLVTCDVHYKSFKSRLKSTELTVDCADSVAPVGLAVHFSHNSIIAVRL